MGSLLAGVDAAAAAAPSSIAANLGTAATPPLAPFAAPAAALTPEQEVTAIYQQHNPAKLGNVPALMLK